MNYICPYCQSSNRNDEPFNGFSAKYSCIDKNHKFYYRNDFNFILSITQYPYHMLAQNEFGCSFLINKIVDLSSLGISKIHIQNILTVKLETIHYSNAFKTFMRIKNLAVYT